MPKLISLNAFKKFTPNIYNAIHGPMKPSIEKITWIETMSILFKQIYG